MKNKTLWGHLMVLATMLIWGTTYISTKLLLVELSPIQILFYRFLMAWVVLALIHPKFAKPASWKTELLFLGAGLCGVTLYFLIENTALVFTLASNVGLLISLAPILTALLAHFVTKDEKFKPNLLVGFALAIVGAFLVIFNGSFILRLNPLGDLLALSAALVWAVYSILLKKIGDGLNPIVVTRKIFGYGLVLMVPVMAASGFRFDPGQLGAPGVMPNLLFLGLAASALGFVLWNSSVSLIGVVKASNYIYLVPLITIATAVIVLREPITVFALAGAALILCGVYISEHRGLLRRRTAKTLQGAID